MNNGEELAGRESTRSESSSGDWSDLERELEAALGERSPSGQDAGKRDDDVKPGREASSPARIAVRSRGNTGGEAGSATGPSPSRTDSRKRLLEEGSGDASVPPTATKLGRRSGSAAERGTGAASDTAAGSANQAGWAAGASTLRGPLEPGECEHPGYFGGLCYVCGAPDPAGEEEAGATEVGHGQGHGGGTQQYQKMSYLHPAMKISTSEVQRMQELAGRQLAARRRLILILDLDHTLLHSTAEADLRAEERARLVEMQGTETRRVERPELRMLHHLPQCQLWTKLRPGVRQFLAEVSELYEMYIYTAGNRWYAYSMANLLDPDGLWFRNRIISKQDSSMPGEIGKRKHLSIVLGQESSVVILDDTLQVWKDHQANLLLTSRYCFFRTLSFQPMLYELYERGGYLHTGADEDAACGQLAVFSRVLRMLHEECFSDTGAGQDVRDVLRRLQRSVLHSCTLAFSHVIPQELRDPSQHPAWQLAEQLGAHVVPEVGPDCTQLISFSLKTRKALQAEKDRVPVLHPTWLEACRFNWRQEPPEKYLLSAWKGREPAPVRAETPADAGPGSKVSLAPVSSSDDAAAAPAAAGQNSTAPAPAARSSGSE